MTNIDKKLIILFIIEFIFIYISNYFENLWLIAPLIFINIVILKLKEKQNDKN